MSRENIYMPRKIGESFNKNKNDFFFHSFCDPGKSGVREYWEMLSGYDKGYEHAKQEWLKISAVHKKIFNYVKKRLSHKYSDAVENNTLAAHLLGKEI